MKKKLMLMLLVAFAGTFLFTGCTKKNKEKEEQSSDAEEESGGIVLDAESTITVDIQDDDKKD